MNKFIIIALLLFPLSALSQPQHTWYDFNEIGVLDNCNVASINSAVVCGGTRGIDVEGFRHLTLSILYTRSAGTGYEFYLEECYEGQASTNCTDATDWHTVGIVHTKTTEISLIDQPFRRTVSANDQFTLTIGINYKRIRLSAFVATGSPDANDKITVRARVVAK